MIHVSIGLNYCRLLKVVGKDQTEANTVFWCTVWPQEQLLYGHCQIICTVTGNIFFIVYCMFYKLAVIFTVLAGVPPFPHPL